MLLTNAERASGFFPEHTMVDGVLHLTDELSELRPLRHIRVLKLRGSAPVRGLHSVRITRQRLRGAAENRDAVSRTVRSASIASPTARSWRSGCRSSTTCCAEACGRARSPCCWGRPAAARPCSACSSSREGLKRGERGVYFGFYEHPEAILAKCQRVGIGGLKEGVERGHAEIVWHRPVEGVIDELGESLIETVRKVGAHRLLIDGMEGFERAADFPERLSHVYSAIAQELERLGVTTLYTTETRELFGKNIEVPINGLSAATQNIILLRHIEHRATHAARDGAS